MSRRSRGNRARVPRVESKSGAGLLARRGWVFDMDGTLTKAVHDFEAIRKELEIPAGRPILEAIAAMPAEVAAEKTTHLDSIESALAQRAEAARGAHRLLHTLATQNARRGILTRNSLPNARRTLAACGLDPFFIAVDVLGRDEAPPKPNPGGLIALLERWGLAPSEAVMVGDYRYDLEVGRAAGVTTVYVDPSGAFPFRDLADLCVEHLEALLPT